MLKTSIHSPKNGYSLKINEDGSINAFIIPSPPLENQVSALPFSEYMKLNGNGTTSFIVNGAVTNQEFYIESKSYDVYVNTIVFEIADAGATLSQFGALTALTNGLDFYYFNQSNGKYIIESGLKSNYDFVKLSNFDPSYGTGSSAFQLTNAISSAEAYVGVIDFEDVFGLPWGLKLRADSTDRLGFSVKDNLTGIDVMTMKVYGIRV